MRVSVIVPVYNVSRYLREGLDSLAAQTYPAWDAVLVDDGSTDGSGAILDAYAARDARFKVVHKPNGGLSSARNAGIDASAGEVLLFFDPDDTVAPDWIARLVAGIKDVDLAWGGATEICAEHARALVACDVGARYVGDDVRRRVWRAVFGYRLRDLSGLLMRGGMWRRCRREFGSVCWRAFRRAVLGELRFDERVGLYEDAIFLSAYAQRARSMRIVGDTGYRYVVRPGGMMTSEAKDHLVRHKFELRDARRKIDARMTAWRGSFLLSALEILRITKSLRKTWRYLRFDTEGQLREDNAKMI